MPLLAIFCWITISSTDEKIFFMLSLSVAQILCVKMFSRSGPATYHDRRKDKEKCSAPYLQHRCHPSPLLLLPTRAHAQNDTSSLPILTAQAHPTPFTFLNSLMM